MSESGEFVAQRVAPGSYFVSVRADKYGETYEEVEIGAGRETEATFELQALTRLEGVVVDNKGEPLGEIPVRAIKIRDVLNGTEWISIFGRPVRWEDVYGLGKTKSRPDGRFVLENLEQTEYRVLAEAPQGRSVFVDVSIRRDVQEFVQLVFDHGSSTIGGYVYGEDGNPIGSAEIVVEGSGGKARTQTDEQGRYVFGDLLPGRYFVKAQIGGETSRHYRGREIELGEGEQASLDIVVWGEGEIDGEVTLAGDAARAAAWFAGTTGIGHDKRLVLRETTPSEVAVGRELRLPVEDAFKFTNIPAGTYEVWAYYVVRVSPEPIPFSLNMRYFDTRPCLVKFISQPQVIHVASGSRAAFHLTISEACTPHYPIPDPASVEKQVGTE